MSLANLITLARLPLLLLLVAFLFVPRQWVQFLTLGLMIILFLMDWFDGYVARLRQEVTELGAVLDVALDRAVETSCGLPSCPWEWCPCGCPSFF